MSERVEKIIKEKEIKGRRYKCFQCKFLHVKKLNKRPIALSCMRSGFKDQYTTIVNFYGELLHNPSRLDNCEAFEEKERMDEGNLMKVDFPKCPKCSNKGNVSFRGEAKIHDKDGLMFDCQDKDCMFFFVVPKKDIFGKEIDWGITRLF